MQNGWVKVHRKLLDNDLLMNDTSCYILFTRLLLVADSSTGRYVTGRFRLGELTKLKPTTAWAALKRLEVEKVVRLFSDNKKTTIYICNWKTYQQSNDILMTTNRQQNDTKQEVISKNKEISRTDVLPFYDLYISLNNKNPNTYKLTNPRITKLRLRLADAGEEMLRQAINNAARSEFHSGKNSTGWKADLDWIIKSYEQVEKMASLFTTQKETLLEKIKRERQEAQSEVANRN